MMMLRRRDYLAICLAVIFIVTFMFAGFWQLGRAAQKDAIQQRLDAAISAPPVVLNAGIDADLSLNFRRVRVRGKWLASQSILLDNKISEGVVGYYVITPLQVDGESRAILVNRGWVKAPNLRSELPLIDTPNKTIEIEGLARVPNDRFLELGKVAIEGPVWQNLTLARFREWSGLSLYSVMLYQQTPITSSLRLVQPAPEASVMNADRHRGYALTWFGLAAVTFILSLLAWQKNLRKTSS